MSKGNCFYHPDVPIRDKFSPCPRCVHEFFHKHGIIDEAAPIEISIEDIMVELDEITQEKK